MQHEHGWSVHKKKEKETRRLLLEARTGPLAGVGVLFSRGAHAPRLIKFWTCSDHNLSCGRTGVAQNISSPEVSVILFHEFDQNALISAHQASTYMPYSSTTSNLHIFCRGKQVSRVPHPSGSQAVLLSFSKILVPYLRMFAVRWLNFFQTPRERSKQLLMNQTSCQSYSAQGSKGMAFTLFAI